MKDVNSEPGKALAEWRKASRWATEAEEAVFLASMAFARGEGPLPAPSTREAAMQLRSRANDLYEVAISQLLASNAGLRGDGPRPPPSRADRR